VQHDFVGVLGVIGSISLVPVVRDGVGKDGAVVVEVCTADAAADFGVALETVLGVLVPEVECAVAAGGAEGAVDGVEGDGVDRVDVGYVTGVGGVLTMALEREVGAGRGVSVCSWTVSDEIKLTSSPFPRRIG
jgi:hypothetical protein